MEAYRLKHIPTGLYFTPSRSAGNLSVKGKVYVDRKPSMEWVKTIRIKIWSYKKDPSAKNKAICDFFNIDYDKGYVDTYVKTDIEDWIIEKL